MGHAATAVPAFIGIQDDGWLALLWIRYKHIHLAYVHTYVTSVADLRVKYHWLARSRRIGGGIHLFHIDLPTLGNGLVSWENNPCLSNPENLVKENLNDVLNEQDWVSVKSNRLDSFPLRGEQYPEG
jgi:hypothetical protein